MKKLQIRGEIILIFLTIAFVAFTVGYFRGSNQPLETELPDAVRVTVDRLAEAELAEPVTEASSSSELININTALREELESLPGIGPELAERIMEHRDRIGGFREISDICLVDGVDQEVYEAIQELITVR